MRGLSMPVEAVAERKENLYFSLLHDLKPVPEVLEHIVAQHGQIPFAVVSGSTRESIVKSLTAVGLLDRFPILVGSEDYARSKPAPDAFLTAAARLGVAPKDCLVFEDTDMGIQAATAAGMASVRIPQPRERSNGTAPAPLRKHSLRKHQEERFVFTPHSTSPRATALASPILAILFAIAAAFALLHLLTNGRYGFHRDELQFLSDARHLDWGFVAYPPFTPFIEHIALALFGISIVGLRLTAVIAQFAVVILAGLMTKDLGGARLAQVTAALAVGFSPLPIFEGHEFQYTSFDLLWWVLAAYFVIRLLKSEDPRWWVAIGATLGLGLETKYAIVFYIAGILAGLILTPARRFLKSGWFWAGVALALLIFLPNLIWLVRHNWVSYTFLQHIHQRDVGEGRANGFLSGQFLICANLAAAPLWIAGFIGYLRDRRYRMIAFMYLVPLVIFLGQQRPPLLRGPGLSHAPRDGRRPAPSVGCAHSRAGAASPSRPPTSLASLLSPSSCARCFCLSRLAARSSNTPSATVTTCAKKSAGTTSSAPSPKSATPCRPISRRTSASPPATTANTAPLMSSAAPTTSPSPSAPPTPNTCAATQPLRPPPSSSSASRASRPTPSSPAAAWPAHNGNSEGAQNEESQYHPDIFVCGPTRLPLPELWKNHQDFG